MTCFVHVCVRQTCLPLVSHSAEMSERSLLLIFERCKKKRKVTLFLAPSSPISVSVLSPPP